MGWIVALNIYGGLHVLLYHGSGAPLGNERSEGCARRGEELGRRGATRASASAEETDG